MRRIVVIAPCARVRMPEPADALVPAEELWDGPDHRTLMRGIAAYREAGEPAGPLDLRILSAGHGLVGATELVRGYEQTYDDLGPSALDQLAAARAIPVAVDALLRRPMRFGLTVLPEKYLRACALSPTLEPGGPVYAVCDAFSAERLPRSVRPVLSADRAEVGARLLEALAEDHRLLDELPLGELLRQLTAAASAQCS
jgi:hypothetical protein